VERAPLALGRDPHHCAAGIVPSQVRPKRIRRQRANLQRRE
jgi:hypothetical protein